MAVCSGRRVRQGPGTSAAAAGGDRKVQRTVSHPCCTHGVESRDGVLFLYYVPPCGFRAHRALGALGESEERYSGFIKVF